LNVSTYSDACVVIVPPPVVNFGAYPSYDVFAGFQVFIYSSFIQEPHPSGLPKRLYELFKPASYKTCS
jgi:hypothetical protein